MSFRLPGQTPEGPAEPLHRPDLIAYLHQQSKTRDRWRIGAEFEKLVLDRDSGAQLPYRGPDGIEAVLGRLSSQFGWTAHHEGADLVALTRSQGCAEATSRHRSTITLEPGAQIELATPPCKTLWTMDQELARHRDELRAVLDPDRFAVVATGLSPFQPVPEIGLTARERHRIMAQYLPARGHLALHMMKATCSVQVALDYGSEADAARKFFCALTLSPVSTALFANSPLEAGRDTGLVSFRGRVWQHTDPARSGLLAGLVGDGDFSFERWVDWLLDVPMMFYAIQDTWEPAHGRTFRQWMAEGHRGHYPTMADWEMHLTSVFPEVRLKQFVEVRGADAVPPALAMGFPALWTGIFYDDGALEEGLALARALGGDEREALFEVAITRGLAGEHRGRTLAAWARDALDIARRGLKRRAVAEGLPDESHYLDAISEIAESGRSPGDHLRAWLAAHPGASRREIIGRIEY